MENILAWLLFIIVGSTVVYLSIAKIIVPLIQMIKESARLK